MRALDRVISVLEVVAESSEPVSVTDIAELSGLTVATASRLVHSLVDVRMLDRAENGPRLRLGSRLIALAESEGARGAFAVRALHPMRLVRDHTGETVSLHVRFGDQRVCIAEVQSRHELRRIVPLGLALPLHVGPTGRALLAGMAEEDRRVYAGRAGLSETVLVRTAEVAARGWDWAVDERTAGVSGLSVVLRNTPPTVAALSVSGPGTRWTETAMQAQLAGILALVSHFDRARDRGTAGDGTARDG